MADSGTLENFCEQVEELGVGLCGRQAEQLRSHRELAKLQPRVVEVLRASLPTQATAQLRLIAAMARFWWMQGLGPEIAAEVEAVLARETDGVPASTVARAHQGAGELAYARADYPTAIRYLDAAKAGFAASAQASRESITGQGGAANWLGMVAREQGRYDEAKAHHEEASRHYLASSNTWGQAHAWSNLGVVAFRCGALDEALKLHTKALSLRQEIDDLHGISSSVGNLALVHRTRGDLARARSMYLQSLEARELLDDRWGVAGSAVCLCVVETKLGELAAAKQHLRAAVFGFLAVGDDLGVAESAEAALELFVDDGDLGRGLKAYGIGLAARRLVKAPAPATEQDKHQERVTRLVGALGAARLAEQQAWAARAEIEQVRALLQTLVSSDRCI
ncbi:MAG: tetratricopeptide repeat protein [Nannocystaceae bacterium]